MGKKNKQTKPVKHGGKVVKAAKKAPAKKAAATKAPPKPAPKPPPVKRQAPKRQATKAPAKRSTRAAPKAAPRARAKAPAKRAPTKAKGKAPVKRSPGKPGPKGKAPTKAKGKGKTPPKRQAPAKRPPRPTPTKGQLAKDEIIGTRSGVPYYPDLKSAKAALGKVKLQSRSPFETSKEAGDKYSVIGGAAYFVIVRQQINGVPAFVPYFVEDLWNKVKPKKSARGPAKPKGGSGSRFRQ